MRLIFTCIALLFCCQLVAFANQPVSTFSFQFVQNKGQWPGPVLYATKLPQGWLFLEKDRFTYNFLEQDYFNLEDESASEKQFTGHAFQVEFVKANPQTRLLCKAKAQGYHNYFIGNDPAKWATGVNAFGEIIYQSLFPKVNLRIYTASNSLKYDYIVAPQGDAAAIKMKYHGAQQLALKDGKLYIKTSVNEIYEEAPFAYQVINGVQKQVACAFTLDDSVVGFSISGDYDKRLPLTIDPELVFVTYTGSTTGISANCATTDAFSNTYASGRLLGEHYPVTMGAYQTVRRGNNVAISKFNHDGTQLLFATYLGGSTSEYPLGMVVNKQDELIICGFTSSNNFPTSDNAFDKTINSGPFLQDYFISKISGDGKSLIGSTYLGGNGREGGGTSDEPAGIALDATGNIIMAGASPSPDFPIVNGFQKKIPSVSPNPGAPAQKCGIIAKFNPSLSALMWSTYMGGKGTDFISDIKVGPASGKIYISGNTTSTDFPITAGALNKALQGGRDGFVAVISLPDSKLETCTFLGTSQTDYAQLLALDAGENVYVAGYTSGTYPVTPGTYSTSKAPGGYFIHKLTNNLSTTLFSTHLGENIQSSPANYIPTAFQVDDCENIYFTAYAVTNAPLTADALQKERRSLYLCHLSKDAKELSYGSYFGSTHFNHVHYANHGFITKNGVFHNIECSTSKAFQATPGAYSNGATTANRNDGIISKFHFLPKHLVRAQLDKPRDICAPSSIRFSNKSINATSYSWNFGDGSAESADQNPEHIYQNPGRYTIRLIATNPANCNKADTTYMEVAALIKPGAVLPQKVQYLCDQSLVLDAGDSGISYKWSTGETSQKITASNPGTYEVEIYNGECTVLHKVTVSKPLPLLDAPNIFTPNKDGKNDFFEIKNIAPGTKVKIYNRWGKLIFKADDYQNNWDGKDISKGTYFYLIETPGSCTPQKGWLEINL